MTKPCLLPGWLAGRLAGRQAARGCDKLEVRKWLEIQAKIRGDVTQQCQQSARVDRRWHVKCAELDASGRS